MRVKTAVTKREALSQPHPGRAVKLEVMLESLSGGSIVSASVEPLIVNSLEEFRVQMEML